MLKRIYYIVIVALIVSLTEVSAYDFHKAMDEGKSFAQIKQEAHQYWDERGITVNSPKGERGGLKQYLRWEWFWETRLMPDGSFPPAGMVYNEMLQYQNNLNKGKNKVKLQGLFDPEWDNLGPATAPGGYEGIGRINAVVEDPGYNGSSNKILWAGSTSGGLWKSTDAGSTWTHKTKTLGTLGIGDIVINPDDGTIYCATGDGDAGDAYSIGVIKSTDGGNTWASAGLSWSLNQTYICRRMIMDKDKPDTMLVATNGGVYYTRDGGANWSQGLTGQVYDIEFKPGNTSIVYASTYSAIYKSTDGGATWTQKTSGLPTTSKRIALAVAPSSSNTVYAEYTNTSTSGHAGFYRSTDSGENWTKMDNTFKNLLGWRTDGSDTGGQSWYDLCVVVNPTNANEVYVGGVNTWKSTNGGSTWTCITMWYGGAGVAEVHADQHCLYMPNSARLYSGNDGGVDISTNNGSTWSYIGSGIECTQFYRLGISQNDTSLVICGAQDNSMFLKDGSDFSVTSMTGDGFEGLIDYTDDNIMYCSSYYGNWEYSTNGGSSWSNGPKPSSDPGAWLTPYVMHPTNHNYVYFGFTDGVYKFDKTNTTTTKVGDPNTGSNNNLFIAPSNANIMIAGSYTSIKKSTNGGVSWATMTMPSSASCSYFAFHPTDASKIWFTRSGHSSGNKVYYSTNGGTSWTNISGTLPNVSCNTICYVPDGTSYKLFIGMDSGVWYRGENDSDWTQLDNKFPAVVVTELEYEPDTKTLFAATYGRGLWKLILEEATTVTPDVPTLVLPINLSEGIISPVTFKWNTATNATSYRLEIATDADFTTGYASYKSITDTSKVISTLSDNQKYYWRVKSYSSSSDSSAWSSSYIFTTGECVKSVAGLDITVRLYGLWDGTTHRKAAMMVEFHDSLANITDSETATYKKQGVINANGTINLDMTGIADGDYYVIVKTTGYLPCVTKNKLTITTGSRATLSLMSPTDLVSGDEVLLYETSTYFVKAGDINYDLRINANDAIYIPLNNGKNANLEIPKP